MKKYFLTYGNDKFKYSKIHLSYLAKYSGFFDEVITLGPENLSNIFTNKFKEILSNKKGAGYWIWKHEIIRSLLNEINSNDIILYCDAGSSINNSSKAKIRFNEYFEILNDKKVNFLRFETNKQYLEKQYTSIEVFKELNVDINSHIGNSTQLQAGVMFFKKTFDSVEFLNDYKNIISKDPNLITDAYSTNQKKDFIECRHDQSIFSILGKQYNSFILENETEFMYRKREQFDFPILTVRASNHGLKDKIKLKYFIKIYGKKTKYFN